MLFLFTALLLTFLLTTIATLTLTINFLGLNHLSDWLWSKSFNSFLTTPLSESEQFPIRSLGSLLITASFSVLLLAIKIYLAIKRGDLWVAPFFITLSIWYVFFRLWFLLSINLVNS